MSYIGNDKIGSMYLGSEKIGKAYLGSDLVYSVPISLPSGYKECEYIFNNYYGGRAAYISTGVKGSSELRIVTKLANEQDPRKIWPFIFGCRGANNYPNYTCYSYDTYPIHAITVSGSNFKNSTWRTQSTSPHTMDLNKYRLIFDGVERPSETSSTWTSNLIFDIFGFNNNGSRGEGSPKCKIYYFKMYDGNTLVRNYVPAYQESSRKYGLYDLVNNTFSSSSNTSEGKELTGLIKT